MGDSFLPFLEIEVVGSFVQFPWRFGTRIRAPEYVQEIEETSVL